ncbi:hypothetical protein ACFQDN_16015 [Pseudomonas asuensis]
MLGLPRREVHLEFTQHEQCSHVPRPVGIICWFYTSIRQHLASHKNG